MNNQDAILDEIIVLKGELHELYLKHYAEKELFSVTWWINIALLLIPLIIWWKMVDKKRLPEIMIFGFACNVFAAFLDVFLTDYLLWEYPVRVVPQISLFVPVDYVIVPVVGMYLYQKFPKWGPFLLASTLASAFMSFICEPLAVAINMYKLLTWRYVYSFPIYIAINAAFKFFTQRVMKIKGG
jgi:hypothetical protein